MENIEGGDAGHEDTKEQPKPDEWQLKVDAARAEVDTQEKRLKDFRNKIDSGS